MSNLICLIMQQNLIDTSKLAAKSNLVSLKAELDKLDLDKIKKCTN